MKLRKNMEKIILVFGLLLFPLCAFALTNSELIDFYDYSYYNGSINVTAFSDRMADNDADGKNDTLIITLETDATSNTYTFIAEVLDKNGLYANETSKTFSSGNSNISINIPSELLSQPKFNYTIRAMASDSNLVYRSNKQQTQSYTNYEPGFSVLSISDQNVGNNFIRINVHIKANYSSTVNVTVTLAYNDTSISKTEQKSLVAGSQNVSIDFDNETIKKTHYNEKYTIDSIQIKNKLNDTNRNTSSYNYETFAKTSYIKAIKDGRIDLDADNLTDFLEINFTIEAKSNGLHNLTYDIYDEFSNFVRSYNASPSLSIGTNNIQTRINGSEIYKSRISGPYVISTSKIEMGNFTDSVISWHRINSSSYTEFERPPLPDLTLTMSTSFSATNNQTNITINISNPGKTPAFNVFLDIFDNNTFEGNASLSFMNLSNFTIFRFIALNTTNDSLITAIVDFDNFVDESNESNNIAQNTQITSESESRNLSSQVRTLQESYTNSQLVKLTDPPGLVDRTASTDTYQDENSVYTKIIYSGVRNVYEDFRWKPVEEARSLKDKGFNVIYLENDPNLIIEVLDFNYSSITYRASVKGDKIGKDVPIRIYTENPLFDSIEWKTNNPQKELSWKDRSIMQNERRQLFSKSDDVLIETISFGLDHYLQFGENSTVIILQDADTENLGDTQTQMVDNPSFNHGSDTNVRTDSSRVWRVYLKFDLQQIPDSATLLESYLNMYAGGDDLTTLSAHHVYNHTWAEGNLSGADCTSESQCEGGIIHTRQPCGANFNISQQCNLTAENNLTTPGPGNWHKFNVTNSVRNEFQGNFNNVSIVIRDASGGSFEQVAYFSKEHSNISARPYLNVSYVSSQKTTPEENQSKIVNNGQGIETIYLLMKVQYNNSGSWSDEATVVDDSSPRSLNPGETLALDTIWNPVAWNTSSRAHGDKTYRAYIAATDSSNNILTNGNGSQIIATYNFLIDTISPIISNLQNSTTTNQSIVITWNTDEVTNQTLTIGICPSVSNVNTYRNSSLVTSHIQSISGLSNSTIYCMNVTVSDALGNKANASLSVTTASNQQQPDTTPPTISNLRNSTTSNQSATISWDTNEAANSTLTLGVCPSFTNVNTYNNNTFSTSRNQATANLANFTTYCTNVTVFDSSGNKAFSNISFKTAQNIKPRLNITLLAPLANINVSQNASFNFTIQVCCLGNNCDQVNASLDPIAKTAEFTPSSETHCENGICNKIQYSGTRFVNEDGKWVPIEEAKSLKGLFDVVIDEDPNYPVEVVDFNHKSITFDLSVSAQKTNRLIPLKIYDKHKLQKPRDTFGEVIDKDTSIGIASSNSKIRKTIDLSDTADNILSMEFKWGENSTTIIIQDADTENLDDGIARQAASGTEYGAFNTLYAQNLTTSGNEYQSMLKFTLSEIPAGSTIDNATLYLYQFGNALDAGESLSASVYKVNNSWSWTEGTGTSVGSTCSGSEFCWNNRPTGSQYSSVLSALTLNTGEGSQFRKLNIKNGVQSAVDSSESQISLLLLSRVASGSPVNGDYVRFYSKEGSTSSLRPYLNITYSTGGGGGPAPIKSGLVNTTIGAIPFYTNGTNPMNISLSLNQCQNVQWWVNATGSKNTTHEFFAFVNKTTQMSISNETKHINISII